MSTAFAPRLNSGSDMELFLGQTDALSKYSWPGFGAHVVAALPPDERAERMAHIVAILSLFGNRHETLSKLLLESYLWCESTRHFLYGLGWRAGNIVVIDLHRKHMFRPAVTHPWAALRLPHYTNGDVGDFLSEQIPEGQTNAARETLDKEPAIFPHLGSPVDKMRTAHIKRIISWAKEPGSINLTLQDLLRTLGSDTWPADIGQLLNEQLSSDRFRERVRVAIRLQIESLLLAGYIQAITLQRFFQNDKRDFSRLQNAATIMSPLERRL